MPACRLLCALLLLQWAAPAPAEEYSHRIYRTEDGLPQNQIRAITQTADGYLWIGTSEGLARFDGARFTVFDRSNSPAFRDNGILSFEAAPDGSLWIGTEGGGLLHYEHGAFRAFGQSDGLSNGFVRALRLDRQGVLWVGTDRGFFRKSNQRFARLDDTPAIPLASVLSIAEDTSGRMWVATSTGLLIEDRGVLSRAPCAASKVLPVRAVAFLHEGLIKDGCDVPAISMPDADVSSMRRDEAGNLWIGTRGQGLLKISHGNIVAYKAPLFLPENTVFVVFEDRQHNMWIGGLDGLVRLGHTAVTTITARDGLEDENVTSTYEDPEGRLWITTFSGQIYRMKGTVPERYKLPSAAERALKVRTVLEDSAGSQWFGTGGAGVIRQSRNGTVHYTRDDGLGNNNVRQMIEGPYGTIWIATGSGLSRWDGKKIVNFYLPEGLSYPSVRCLALEPSGDLLVGTDAGLNRVHQGRIVPDPAFAELRQVPVWSIFVDNDAIWLGTRGGGLMRVKAGRVARLTTANGLGSNSIYQIVDDRNGNLWMTSPAGVFSATRAELARVADGTYRTVNSVVYGRSDGMDTSEMSGGFQTAGCRRLSGELWFPSARGVVKIDPLHMAEQPPPTALIEKVTAGDFSFIPSEEVVIPPGLGKVQIEYTACNLIGPKRLSFTYKLEGFDENWGAPSQLRFAHYSNLPPGHYRFRVVAADSGARGRTSEASVAIYLKPAFYQTTVFAVLLASAFVGLVWAGLWAYTKRTKKHFALLLNERTRLAREMHDTVIQGCIGVSALVEAAARSQRTNMDESRQLLEHARIQVKATIDEARQAVWDLRHPVGEEAAISNLFDLARKLGEEHATQVDTSIAGSMAPLDPATSQAMLLIGREALRNAVTHGNPGRIVVRIAFEGAQVRMEILDDGIGFNPSDAAGEPLRHFGIVGMRERVEELGGEFSVRSRPGQGTSVVVVLPTARRRALHHSPVHL